MNKELNEKEIIIKLCEMLDVEIKKAKRKNECMFDLCTNKKILDIQENGLTDILMIVFTTNFDSKFFNNEYYKVKEYSEDNFRKFDTLEELAKWLYYTYIM